MLKISEAQNIALSQVMLGRFTSLTLEFLRETRPEYCTDQSDDDLRAFILEMTEFARSNNVQTEQNIQKLIIHRIDGRLTIPLSGYQRMRLRDSASSEDFRMAALEQTFEEGGKTLTRISLDDV